MEEELLDLAVQAASGGMGSFLDGSVMKSMRKNLRQLEKREKRKKSRSARDEATILFEKQERARVANLHWQKQSRDRKLKKELIKSLEMYFMQQEVPEYIIDEWIDKSARIHEGMPRRVRKALIQKRDQNFCQVCKELKDARCFKVAKGGILYNTCMKCSRPKDNPLHILLKKQVTNSRSRCEKKRKDGQSGSEHNITVDFLVDMFVEQGGKCVLCNKGMTCVISDRRSGVKQSQWLKGTPSNVSVDQIRPGRGYTCDNTQLLHLQCNLIKRDMDQDEFIHLCQDIAEHMYTI